MKTREQVIAEFETLDSAFQDVRLRLGNIADALNALASEINEAIINAERDVYGVDPRE